MNYYECQYVEDILADTPVSLTSFIEESLTNHETEIRKWLDADSVYFYLY